MPAMRARCCRCGPTNPTAATRVDWLKRSASAVGWFKTVQVKSPNAHERKALLITRHQLGDMRVRIDNQLRGIRKVAKTGKAPVVEGAEWRKLLSSIPTETVDDLRGRAPIATLTYSFAPIGAALEVKVEDLRPNGSAWTIRLHEKGGRHSPMPCQHALAGMSHAYIAAIGEERTGFPCGECRGGATLDRVLFGRFIEAANWSIGHGIVHSVNEGHYAIFLQMRSQTN
jgi:hypothetical protein